MTIEMPDEHSLWVRFQYDDGHDAATDAANAMYDDFRRSAYQESDIDTIRVLRELAAEGRLDAGLAELNHAPGVQSAQAGTLPGSFCRCSASSRKAVRTPSSMTGW